MLVGVIVFFAVFIASEVTATCGGSCKKALLRPKCWYWVAAAPVTRFAETFSCVNEGYVSETCQTWDSLSDCVNDTRDVQYNEEEYYPCTQKASENKEHWCYQVLQGSWDNCIFVTNKDSAYYNRFVIAQYFRKIDSNDRQREIGTYCWTDGKSKCKSFNKKHFAKCQDKISELREKEEFEDIFTKRCSSKAQNQVDGWCFATKYYTS
eukprot:Awhi_evm1s12878